MEKFEILVVDDEPEMLTSYQRILNRAGYAVTTASTGNAALAAINANHNFMLVISDLKMPGMDGMTLVGMIKKEHPYLPVIMVTGHGSLEKGIEAVKSGVFDFIEKPFSSKKLLNSVEEALKQINPEQGEGHVAGGFDNIVGTSPAMQQVFTLIRKVAYGNANVMITGESGVGKELVARSIHKHSLRRNQPLIPVNCGALPSNLFESELFGYEKGSFTGAFQSKPGLAELANGGTLFLDEICEMPLDLQVKLLRMVENRKIRRIGGKEEKPIDIRILTATNRDAEEAVKTGIMREDLFFRINTIQITVPPLRERRGDLSILTKFFLSRLEQSYGLGVTEIQSEALDIMDHYPWPGNVRELRNVIERSYYLASPPLITTKDLPAYLCEKNPIVPGNWKNKSYRDAKELVLEAFEREYVAYHLEQNNWNISRTAEQCAIDRRTIHRLINKFNLRKSSGNGKH